MDRCEVAQNDDDLSDVFTWMGYASENAGSDSSVFALAWGGVGWQPGHPVSIYNCHTLELVGKAHIKAVTACDDKSALEVRALALMQARLNLSTLAHLQLPHA